MSSLQNKPTGIRHNRRNLLLLFFSNLFFNIFNFNPMNFFPALVRTKIILFFPSFLVKTFSLAFA